MLLRELYEEPQIDEKQVWARKGKSVTRKYRCGSGRRKGRVVSKMQQCFAPLNIKKSVKFKQTKKRMGAKMARKAKRTKRTNPASKRLKNLNRRR
jgi:hypothetical protein|tara:strand:+ start:784 stop:1068 length:285 start_codon:yes stop_codon:yes gene_type:complete